MKVPPKVRQKRISQIQHIYEECSKIIDEYSERIYKIVFSSKLTKEEKVQKIKDLIWDDLEDIIAFVISELKRIYPNSFDEEVKINMEEILYHEQDKYFPERIDEWYKQKDLSNERLFYQMLLIINTESQWIIPRIFRIKLTKNKSDMYVEILQGPGPDWAVQCSDYIPEEAYPESQVELPPYHPNCQCEAIYYERSELLQEDEDTV